MGSENMDSLNMAIELLPAAIKRKLLKNIDKNAEEIRLRLGTNATYVIDNREVEINDCLIGETDLLSVLEKATGASIHTATAAMSEGYISYRGIRIGICGKTSLKNGVFTGYRNINSLNIRIPREYKGICSSVIKDLCRDGFESTLIISPPGYGKTTVLREIIRVLSDYGYRISVADERDELSASRAFDLGLKSDVMSGMYKDMASIMMLRGMNPQIIAMDEITKPEDIKAISEICGCGVAVLASAHAANFSNLKQRPLYRELLALGEFKNIIIIENNKGKRNYLLERINTCDLLGR